MKAYLRYEEGQSFGLVASGQARVCYDLSGKLLLAGALEQFLVWNVKQGRCVNNLVAPPLATGARPPVTAVAPVPLSASLVCSEETSHISFRSGGHITLAHQWCRV